MQAKKPLFSPTVKTCQHRHLVIKCNNNQTESHVLLVLTEKSRKSRSINRSPDHTDQWKCTPTVGECQAQNPDLLTFYLNNSALSYPTAPPQIQNRPTATSSLTMLPYLRLAGSGLISPSTLPCTFFFFNQLHGRQKRKIRGLSTWQPVKGFTEIRRQIRTQRETAWIHRSGTESSDSDFQPYHGGTCFILWTGQKYLTTQCRILLIWRFWISMIHGYTKGENQLVI